MRKAILLFFPLLILLAAPASADVVPPTPCPEGEVWRGAHDGRCEPCPEGTHWERMEDNPEYGTCEEGAASGCATSPARTSPLAALALLGVALGFVARRRRR